MVTRYDPSDPGAVKKRKHKERRRRSLELEDVRALLQRKEGRRFVWRLLSNAGIYRPLFTANSLEIARNAAEHDWCLWLMRDLNEAAPGIVFELAREFREPEEDEGE